MFGSCDYCRGNEIGKYGGCLGLRVRGLVREVQDLRFRLKVRFFNHFRVQSLGLRV